MTIVGRGVGLMLARRGWRVSVLIGLLALGTGGLQLTSGSSAAPTRVQNRSAAATRAVILRATKTRSVGRAGTPTVHLRGFGDFDLGPASLGSGNRSHGDQRQLIAAGKVLVKPPTVRSGARTESVAARLGRLRVVPSLRTADSDTFASASGVYVSRVYTQAVNYLSAGGKFMPINDRLRRVGSVLVARADAGDVRLPLMLDGAASVSGGSNTVRLRFLGSRPSDASVTGSVARYPNAYDGAVASLSAVTGSLHFSYTLANANAQRVFRIAFEFPGGLRARLRGQQLQLVNARGQVRFEIPSPLVLEQAAGHQVPSYAGSGRTRVSLSGHGRRAVLTYAISRSWLKAQHGRFPVVLDPVLYSTFTSSGGTPAPIAGDDCTIFNNAPSSSADCAGGAAYDQVGAGVNNPSFAGGTYVTMMNFPDAFGAAPGGIPADSEVLSATLSMTTETIFGNPVSYAVLPMSDSFTPDEASWNYSNVLTQDKWVCPGGDFEGCASVAPSMIAGTSEFTSTNPNTVNLTALAQAWVDGSQPGWQAAGQKYLSLMLYPTSTDGLAEICRFSTTSSSPCNVSSAAPLLTVDWSPRVGSDPGSDITSTSVDSSTGVGVNVANGNVSVTHSDLNVPGTAGMRLGLSNTYNSDAANGGWTVDQPPSLWPGAGGSDSEVLTGSDGSQSVWDAVPAPAWGKGGVYTPPAGVNGSLCEALPNGNPATAVDSVGQPWVFSVAANGQIQGLFFNGTSWSNQSPSEPFSSGIGIGAPTSVATVAPNTSPTVIAGTGTAGSPGPVQVFYVDSNHLVAEWSYSTSTGTWTDQELGGSVVAPNTSPSAITPSSGSSNQDVYYVATSGVIHELWTAGGAWTDSTVGGSVAANSSPAAFSTGTSTESVYYVGASDDGVYRLAYNGSSWSTSEMTGSPASPAAPNTSLAALDLSGGYEAVDYVSPSGGIYQGAFHAGGWSEASTLIAATATAAPDTSPTETVDSSNNQHIYYTGSDGRFSSLAYSGSAWVVQDPLSEIVAPNTSPTAPLYSAGTLTPFYIGADGNVHEMHWNGSSWVDQALAAAVGTDSCQPKDTGATWELTNYDSGERLDFNSAGQLIAEYDRNGNPITYTYNTNGMLNYIIDTQGRKFSYSYGTNQVTITDVAGGRSVVINENTSGQVTSDVDAAGNQTNYGYTSGQLTSITDPNTVNTPGDDGATTISYPAAPTGALWQVNLQRPAPTAPGSYVTTTYVSYPQGTAPPAGVPTCSGSPGSELAYGYTIITYPNSNWSEDCYDTHDRVYETFDEVTRQPAITTYDANDDITGVVEPTNTEFGSPTLVESATFDACFRPTSHTTGSGATAPMSTETYAKTAISTCSATSPNDYEATASSIPSGAAGVSTTTKYVYDGNGNLKSETDGLSSQNTLSFDYNANGTLADSWDADGQETKYSYSWGQAANVCGPSGTSACSGVLASVTVTPPTVVPAEMGASTSYYDLDGRLTGTIDANHDGSQATFNNDDQLLTEQYFTGATESLVAGAQTVSGTSTGTTINTYDDSGTNHGDGNLLESATTDSQSSDTGTTCYSYWANGQLETEQDPVASGQTGAVSGASPCNLERVTSTTYAYNSNGDMISLTDGGGQVSYGYDQDDRACWVYVGSSTNACGSSAPSGSYRFVYDNDGRLVCTSYPNGMVTEQLYDAYDNLTDIQTANGTSPSPACNPASTTGTPTGTVFQNNAYTYASGSDLQQSQTITQNGTTTAWNYYYDPLNRLIEAAGSQNGSYYYSYDGDGNLLQRTTSASTGAYQTAIYNADNELTGINTYNGSGASTGSYSTQYDNGASSGAGNLTSIGSAAGAISLAYNDQEQTGSINPYGAGAQALGYRGKGQNDAFQTGNVPTGGGIAAPGLEENALGISAYEAPIASGGSAAVTYYTRAPDGTLLGERTPAGNNYYYVQDGNGSVVALTSTGTGAPVVNTYTYDPYGTTTASTTTAPNPFGFDGGYYPSCVNGGTTSPANCPSAVPSTAPTSSTSQNGLILYGTRYYNPATTTWTQPDPDAQNLATDPTQADPYTFAGEDPINNVDLTGEKKKKGKSVVSSVLDSIVSLVTNAPVYGTPNTGIHNTVGDVASTASSVISAVSSSPVAQDVYNAGSGCDFGSGAGAAGGTAFALAVGGPLGMFGAAGFGLGCALGAGSGVFITPLMPWDSYPR